MWGDSNVSPLCPSVNDRKSSMSIHLVVTNAFYHVDEFANTESVNNEG